MSFVHLHLHTEYSLLDSVVRIQSERDEQGVLTVKGLMDATSGAGMPAVALTDQSNLFGMVKFYKAARSVGVKPIIGVDLLVQELGEKAEPSRLVLLCQNEQGYKNLTRIVTRSYIEGQKLGVPIVHRSWLSRESLTGLIALAGPHSHLGRLLLNDKAEEVTQGLDYWRQLFDDRLYLELLRTGRAGEAAHLSAAVEVAQRHGIPVVASNDVRFVSQSDFEAHEARVCIHEGTLLGDTNRVRRYSEQQYLKSPEEMVQLFADLPEAIHNSIEIAKRCSLEVNLGKSVLPAYPVPKGLSTEEFLRQEAQQGLERRLQQLVAQATPGTRQIPHDEYRKRLQLELDVICNMGFAGYFLIVADFIQWSKDNGIPVGPGRGSGAGSLVAYAIKITDIDPLQYDLLFERFLNPERVSMPDFDIDFCMEGRDRVIDYVTQKYGRDRVSQIITYGSMAAKAVVRDVARVMGHSYGFADSVAKLIPFELGITLKSAIAKEDELRRRYQNEEETKALLDLAMSLEGLVRNAGMHAGGVVISPTQLTDFAPLYCADDGTGMVTQFDKDDVEAAGLVKFDFLGLRTLTIIDWTVKTINAQRSKAGQPPLDMSALPLNDQPTYQLMQRGDTAAVFQLESRGMKDLNRRLKPDCFEDIVALVALFRPGPLEAGMVDDFIARKKADAGVPIDYLHPDLKPVLAPTYGVIVYQEQVMQIAQVLAGYTLGGADMLRRAMGKKKPEEMAKQRAIFVDGAKARGVNADQAGFIFDLMEKFAGYGFNKSHSAAYAMLSYQTAWLKVHHTEAFMAAVLSSDMDKTDKVVALIEETRRIGLTVESPNINHSSYMFTVSGPRTIRYGLGAIKGVGQAVVDALVAEREARGPFKSLVDLCQRCDANRLSKRLLEALIRSGALDSFGENRATLMHNLNGATQMADQALKAKVVGQNDMFGLSVEDATDTASLVMEQVPEWHERVRLEGERETLGLYLSGHPYDEYRDELRGMTSGSIADLAGDKPTVPQGEGFRFQGRPVTVAGMVDEVGKRGNRIILKIDDRSGRLEATLFEEAYLQYKSLLTKGSIVLLEGKLRYDDFIDGWRLTVNKVQAVGQVRLQNARRLMIRWPDKSVRDMVPQLEKILKPHRKGACDVAVYYRNNNARAVLHLPEDWKISPSDELLDQLRKVCGSDGVQLSYGRA